MMTTTATPSTSHLRPLLGDRIVDALLLVAVLGVSWTKLFVNLGGKLDLSLVVVIAFLVSFGFLRASRGDWRLPRIAAWLAGWSGIMLIIDLVGLLNIDTAIGRTQFAKAFFLALVAAALLIDKLSLLKRAGAVRPRLKSGRNTNATHTHGEQAVFTPDRTAGMGE